MIIRWTPEASSDLVGIVKHIQSEDVEAARWTAVSLRGKIQTLIRFPNQGRRGEEPNTRELVVPPYVVVYRLNHNAIELLRIWHGSQNRP